MRMSNKYRPYMKSPCTTLFEHPFKVHPSSKINPYGFEKVDITRKHLCKHCIDLKDFCFLTIT